MPVTVSEILQDALQLSDASRIELAERLIETTPIPQGLLDENLNRARQRMENVAAGKSEVVPAAQAHQMVRDALASR